MSEGHCLISHGDAHANRCRVWPALDSMLLAILMHTQSSLELLLIHICYLS